MALRLISSALLAWSLLFPGFAQTLISPLKIDDFENGVAGWKFIGGEEFPGAKGNLAVITYMPHNGQRAAMLYANFSQGGAYVGVWHNFESLKGAEFKEIRFWVRTTNVTRLGIRINDSTDQCHQKQGPFLQRSTNWQQVILKVSDLVGSEHWGGANDGKWHGPAKAFGINLGKDAFAQPDPVEGVLFMDDVEVVPGSAFFGTPSVLSARLDPPVARPGFGTRVTYRWQAVPLGHDYKVFVHFLGPNGKIVIQNDHVPPVATSVWNGHLEYSHTIVVPTDSPEGDYRIRVGLYDPNPGQSGNGRPKLKAAEGAILESGGDSCDVGLVSIRSNAPLPKLPAATLNLDGLKLTFNEDFNDLSISPWGPGTRWIAHTPGHSDFGDAAFADPQNGFPFSIHDGALRIEASRREGRWRAGIISSVDDKGRGFSQKYGYFEMRARFPKGLGTWPAFWLLGVPAVTNKSVPNIEIDVVEQYGVMPNALFATLHVWGPGNKHTAEGEAFIAPGMDDNFHRYGVMVEPKQITWYFDGIELWRQPSPESAHVPLYVLVDLAMGGGWPIDKATSPSYMDVDYVRVYAKP